MLSSLSPASFDDSESSEEVEPGNFEVEAILDVMEEEAEDGVSFCR